MSKRKFVQSVLIRTLPPLGKVKDAIFYAEQVWDVLSAAGYGAERSMHRESRDYFAELNDRQRSAFNQFWKAFNHKQDRNGAAMRWLQLGDLSDEDYRQIIAAAGKEAAKQLPAGGVRKMAQGWLHEKRYLDYKAPAQSRSQSKELELHRLNAELTHLEMLYKSSRSQALENQMHDISKKVAELMRS